MTKLFKFQAPRKGDMYSFRYAEDFVFHPHYAFRKSWAASLHDKALHKLRVKLDVKFCTDRLTGQDIKPLAAFNFVYFKGNAESLAETYQCFLLSEINFKLTQYSYALDMLLPDGRTVRINGNYLGLAFIDPDAAIMFPKGDTCAPLKIIRHGEIVAVIMPMRIL